VKSASSKYRPGRKTPGLIRFGYELVKILSFRFPSLRAIIPQGLHLRSDLQQHKTEEVER